MVSLLGRMNAQDCEMRRQRELALNPDNRGENGLGLNDLNYDRVPPAPPLQRQPMPRLLVPQ